MADGLGSLGALEAGQKAAQGFKKVVNPFVQAGNQQLFGNQKPTTQQGTTPTGEQTLFKRDVSSEFNEKSPFAKNSSTTQQKPQPQGLSQEELAKQEQEKQRQLEQVRQRLFNEIYGNKIQDAGKTQGQQQESTYERMQKAQQEDEERKQQEEEKKQEPVIFTESAKKGIAAMAGKKQKRGFSLGNFFKQKKPTQETGRGAKA